MTTFLAQSPALRYASRAMAQICAGGEKEPMEALERLVREQQVAVDEVLKLLVDELRRQFSADRGTIYLVDHARGELVSRVAHLPELGEIRLKVGEGVAGWVARHGQRVNMQRHARDPRFNPSIDRTTGYQTRSLLAVPVRESGRLIGVIQLLNKYSAGRQAEGRQADARDSIDFSRGDEEALEALGPKIAMILSGSLGGQLGPDQAEPLFFGFSGIIGQSPEMLDVYSRTRRAAQTGATVLIRGESGTGKELIARAIHCNSDRKAGPFVKVDCAALPETLVENELFGHERGAFTGADRTRPGKVQAAEKGTLFLDEIGELPLSVQGRLLRLLQDRSFLMVGGTRPVPADVRFVFATHRDLPTLVAEGRFRADLYYRLNVVSIRLPSLRERGAAEVDRLTEHFLFTLGRRHGRQLRLSPEARQKLHRWHWPGNVRELEHAIESAVVLAPGTVITPDLLPDPLSVGAPTPPLRRRSADTTLPPIDPGDAPADPLSDPTEEAELPRLPDFHTPILPLEQIELAYLRHVLTACGGNRSAAARLLGIGRNTLLRKLGADADTI